MYLALTELSNGFLSYTITSAVHSAMNSVSGQYVVLALGLTPLELPTSKACAVLASFIYHHDLRHIDLFHMLLFPNRSHLTINILRGL